jgi:predicted O-methyltransferase YrrM
MKSAQHNVMPWLGVDDLSSSKCQLIRGNSAEVLRKMNDQGGWNGVGKQSLDLCMIDGNHNSSAVLDDARQVLPLMKVGGWILFDDVENNQDKKMHVAEGLRWWLKEAGDSVKPAWKNRFMECFEVMK